jgi:hypothetical protein
MHYNSGFALVAFGVGGKYKFRPARGGYDKFLRFIDIAVSVAAYNYGFLPGPYRGLNIFNGDGLSENGTVKAASDLSVRRGPGLFKFIFHNAVIIWGNSSAFYAHAVSGDGFSGVHGYFIVGLISVFFAQILILQVNIKVRQYKLFFDNGPDNAGHFVSVHFYYRVFYFDFCHIASILHVVFYFTV